MGIMYDPMARLRHLHNQLQGLFSSTFFWIYVFFWVFDNSPAYTRLLQGASPSLDTTLDALNECKTRMHGIKLTWQDIDMLSGMFSGMCSLDVKYLHAFTCVQKVMPLTHRVYTLVHGRLAYKKNTTVHK